MLKTRSNETLILQRYSEKKTTHIATLLRKRHQEREARGNDINHQLYLFRRTATKASEKAAAAKEKMGKHGDL